jgi:hypothetical protein
MAIQFPKRKGFVLISPEATHILREPPKSIHTRKKERIDESDVQYMIRSDDSRISENVLYVPRGSNPMADVNYNNYGGGSRTTTFANVQAQNPLRLSGVFRPPLQRQEDLLPLSRMKRPESSVTTNPGLSNMANPNLNKDLDKAQILRSIDKTRRGYQSIRPTAKYNISVPMEIFTGGNIKNALYASAFTNVSNSYNTVQNPFAENKPKEISENVLRGSFASNPYGLSDTERYENIDINNFIKDNPILKNISPNFSLTLINPETNINTNVSASIKDLQTIAVQASMGLPISLTTENNENIKLKDYRYKVVNTNAGLDKLVLYVPEYEYTLERNTPLYSLGSNISGYTTNERNGLNVITNDKIKVSAETAKATSIGRGNEASRDTEYTKKLKGLGSVGSFTGDRNVGTVTRENNNYRLNNNKRDDIRMYSQQQLGSDMGGRYD